MKLLVLSLSILMLTVASGMATPAPSLDRTAPLIPLPATTPEVAAQAFYSWYMHLLNQEKDPLTDAKKEVKKYVTKRLLKEIDRMVKGPDGLNGDYFVDAQDFDRQWETNITATERSRKGKTAVVDVVLTGPDLGVRNLQVTLRQEKSGWKIDKVKGMNQ